MLEKIINKNEAKKLNEMNLLASLFFIVNKQLLKKSIYAKESSEFYSILSEATEDSKQFDEMATDVDICLSRSYLQKFLYESDDDLQKIIDSTDRVSAYLKYKSLDEILRLMSWEDDLIKAYKEIEKNSAIFKTTTNVNISRVSKRKDDIQLLNRMLKIAVRGEFNYNV